MRAPRRPRRLNLHRPRRLNLHRPRRLNLHRPRRLLQKVLAPLNRTHLHLSQLVHRPQNHLTRHHLNRARVVLSPDLPRHHVRHHLTRAQVVLSPDLPRHHVRRHRNQLVRRHRNQLVRHRQSQVRAQLHLTLLSQLAHLETLHPLALMGLDGPHLNQFRQQLTKAFESLCLRLFQSIRVHFEFLCPL